MKNFFTPRVRIVLVVAVLLAVIVAVVSGLTGISVPDMVVKGILTPARAGLSKLTDQAEQLYSYVFRYEALVAENESLKKQIAQMEDDARVADSVSRENDRLRDMVGLKASHSDYEMADGYIISWDSNDWTSTFTINQGTNAGIAEGMCAITANGELVGLVIEVGSNYSVVKSVMDSSLEISSSISSSGYNGMVKGGYIVGKSELLRMNYLPSESIIHINDQVVTTGSTVYPRGLVVGKVVDAGFDDTGVAKFAYLEPAADIDSLEQVFIITKFNVG